VIDGVNASGVDRGTMDTLYRLGINAIIVGEENLYASSAVYIADAAIGVYHKILSWPGLSMRWAVVEKSRFGASASHKAPSP
jgi:hypothetical protein